MKSSKKSGSNCFFYIQSGLPLEDVKSLSTQEMEVSTYYGKQRAEKMRFYAILTMSVVLPVISGYILQLIINASVTEFTKFFLTLAFAPYFMSLFYRVSVNKMPRAYKRFRVAESEYKNSMIYLDLVRAELDYKVLSRA